MRRLIVALAVVSSIIVVAAPMANAQEAPEADSELLVTTDYPAVTAEAGDTVTFDLEIFAPTRREVDLTVLRVPEAWSTTLRGGGFVIDGITADPESPPRAELEVLVPLDAAPGPYELQLRAEGGGLRDVLDLRVTVADRPVGGVELTTDFASLRGRPTETFQYDLEVTNRSPEEITFAFDAEGPEGWNVTAGPATERRASTVTVAGGDTERVSVVANPLSDTPAGTYEIVVTATGGGESGSFVLLAEITGQPSIELVTENGRLNLTGSAGDAHETTILVVNDGTAPLEDVRLTADEPEGWTVSFAPEELVLVEAGQTVPVTLTVEPAGNAVAGDYALGVTARAGGDSADLAYRYTVETSRWWGAIGIAIIAAAFVLLFVVFRRFGRR